LDRTPPKISSEVVRKLQHALIVSCQASTGEPLCSPEHICAMAMSAVNGGATALRLEGAENVARVRKQTDLPIIALTKSKSVPESARMTSVYITPTFEDAAELAAAGADVIALDATFRPRPGGATFVEIVERIRTELKKPVWADVASVDEGLRAGRLGVDVISTTLSGYTAETQNDEETGPDFELLETLANHVDIPVVLEGKVWEPEEVTAAFQLGAYAVVVGSAITRPQLITERFVKAIPY
jgi:N-acylglucosamine-6-phosphate 2-epimerase